MELGQGAWGGFLEEKPCAGVWSSEMRGRLWRG